jgi:glyoxylase-like metal-dependent hydrolase (beta-lactamase superfamily II)
MRDSGSDSLWVRKWLLGGLTILIMAIAVGVCSRIILPRNPLPAQISDLEPESLTIIPGVHLLGGLEPAAAYAIETSEGLVLVDTGVDPLARSLKEQVGQRKLDWKSVCAIFLTHVHVDHSGGAELLRTATGAKIYAGRADAECLRAGRPREAFDSANPMTDLQPRTTTVDVELDGGEVIEIGGVRFRVFATPGHTPGSICYLMEQNGLRVLFSGDVIMALVGDPKNPSRVGRPLGTYPAYMAPHYRGDARAFLTTLRTLRALPAPDLVLPGHPRNDSPPQNPSMSQERWETLLDAGIAEMETLLARYERDGSSFLDDTPRELLPKLYSFGKFNGAAVYGFVASSKFFVLDAPGGPGLYAFLKKGLGKLGGEPASPTAVLLTAYGAKETAGLNDLIEKTGAQVVVSAEGLSQVREQCPPGTVVLPADALPAKGWIQARPIPLGGRGPGRIAYSIPWAGKRVLFSGRIPIGLDASAVALLREDLQKSRASLAEYMASLDQLRSVNPDLWLPADPSRGQNAHLYDHEWESILDMNRDMMLHFSGDRLPNP